MLGLGLEPTTTRFVSATWEQRATTLDVVLARVPACRSLLHRPVHQLERVERKAGQAVYWEYGIGAVFLAIGLMGLIRPTLFSRGAVTQDGSFVTESQTGIRIGAVFTSLAVIPLAAGVADTVRSRDSVYEHEAFRVEVGDEAPCPGPAEPLIHQVITLDAGTWRAEQRTDAGGRVRFDLSTWARAPEEHTAVLRWEDQRAEVRWSSGEGEVAQPGSAQWRVADDAAPPEEARSDVAAGAADAASGAVDRSPAETPEGPTGSSEAPGDAAEGAQGTPSEASEAPQEPPASPPTAPPEGPPATPAQPAPRAQGLELQPRGDEGTR